MSNIEWEEDAVNPTNEIVWEEEDDASRSSLPQDSQEQFITSLGNNNGKVPYSSSILTVLQESKKRKRASSSKEEEKAERIEARRQHILTLLSRVLKYNSECDKENVQAAVRAMIPESLNRVLFQNSKSQRWSLR